MATSNVTNKFFEQIASTCNEQTILLSRLVESRLDRYRTILNEIGLKYLADVMVVLNITKL